MKKWTVLFVFYCPRSGRSDLSMPIILSCFFFTKTSTSCRNVYMIVKLYYRGSLYCHHMY